MSVHTLAMITYKPLYDREPPHPTHMWSLPFRVGVYLTPFTHLCLKAICKTLLYRAEPQMFLTNTQWQLLFDYIPGGKQKKCSWVMEL